MSSRTKTPLHLLARVGHEALLQQYLQTIDAHAIVSLSDMHGNILHANDLFCQVSGYRREELIGSNHSIIKSGHHPPTFYEKMWRTISSGRVWQGEICNRNKNGELSWVQSTIMPFPDETGRPYRYLAIRTDITTQKKIAAKLKEQEDRLRRSQIYADIGTWDWNIHTGELYWSDRIAPLFGFADQVETTYENFLRAVHPEDRPAVNDAIYACVHLSAKYDIEHRVVWPDGTVRWLLERGDVTRNNAGEPQNMLGVVQDITPRKMAELALRTSESRLQEAQRIARLGHWSADFRTGEVVWSDEVYRIFGQNPQEFLPTIENFNSMVHPDDREALRKSEHLALKSGIHDVVHRVLKPDGAPCWVREL